MNEGIVNRAMHSLEARLAAAERERDEANDALNAAARRVGENGAEALAQRGRELNAESRADALAGHLAALRAVL